MRFFISIFTLLLLLSACSKDQQHEQAKKTLETMLGTWTFEGTELSEKWMELSDEHFQGTVYRSFNGVLEPMQHIDIRFTGDSASYIGTRLGAHDSSPAIEYQLKNSEFGSLIFEHKKGGFPQEIRYIIKDTNHFSVTMSGTQDGRSRSQEYNYSRSD